MSKKTDETHSQLIPVFCCFFFLRVPGLGRGVGTLLLVFAMVLVARLLDGALALPLGLTSAVCTTAIMRHGRARNRARFP